MPKKKSKKHPMQMTDEEALRHIFHPKIVSKVKAHLREQNRASKSKSRGKA